MQPVIKVENLGKRYQLGQSQGVRYTALRDVIADKARSLVRGLSKSEKSSTPKVHEFWALQDVNFEINQGDRVGIIGRNGAGKSTLLKVLSRITAPTTGRITIQGRLSSLLEVGTGFHPELTGRENIYLNGAILGMPRRYISRQFDDIVAFAEVEKFLDTPVKRYSSGMYMRLAFAVAAHLEPDILVIDEVLAVGDAQFQKKCLGKMQEVGRDGRTVLFVSHNIGAVKELCTRGIVMSKGTSTQPLEIDDAIHTYQSNDRFGSEATEVTCADGLVVFSGVTLNGDLLSEVPEVFSGEELVFKIPYVSTASGRRLAVGLAIKTRTGVRVFFSHNDLENVRPFSQDSGEVTVSLTPPKLAPDQYVIELQCWLDSQYILSEREIGVFRVMETAAFASNACLATFPSVLMLDSKWSFE